MVSQSLLAKLRPHVFPLFSLCPGNVLYTRPQIYLVSTTMFMLERIGIRVFLRLCGAVSNWVVLSCGSYYYQATSQATRALLNGCSRSLSLDIVENAISLIEYLKVVSLFHLGVSVHRSGTALTSKTFSWRYFIMFISLAILVLTVARTAFGQTGVNCTHPTAFYGQSLDHSATKSGTFNQQYQLILDYYKPGGPILFLQGAETANLSCLVRFS